jgi:hypothetical protein|nr:MAG TPA: Envelope protein [Caudoviricetes sp.]
MKPTLKQWLTVARNFIIELPLEILAFFVVPIALLFIKESDDHLPRCFRWFEDADDFYDGQSAAINGDGGWRREHFPPPKNRSYFARLCWLLRNRIGYFSVKYLGVKVLDVQPASVVTQGDVLITQNKGRKSGFCKVECRLKDGRERFGYYREIRYTGFLSGFYCRIYVGWKLMDIAGANPENWHEFIEDGDKKVLKTVWAFHPMRKVKE